MKRFRRLLYLLYLVAALALVGWIFRTPLLTGLARAWIVEDALVRADAIIILGGGIETRPFEAARLYQQAFAPRILIVKPNSGPTSTMGIRTPEADVTEMILLQHGVPKAGIAVTGHDARNTYEESIAVRAWAGTNHYKSVIIVTDAFHTRRVRWLFRKQLAADGIDVFVRALPVREYTTENWWRHEEGLIAFQNEVLKYAYYRLKY